MNIIGTIDRIAQDLEASYLPALRAYLPECPPSIAIYPRLHYEIGRTLGVPLPGLFIDASYASIQREADFWLAPTPPEVVIAISCSTRLENYVDAVRLRDGMMDVLWAWAIERGWKPKVTYLGGTGAREDPRAWTVLGMLALGPIEE